MSKMFLSATAAIGVLLSCAAAHAAESPFAGIAPMDDQALAAVSGTYRPTLFTLTVGQMARMQDAVARSDFRMTASIGAVTMDNWWFDRAAEPDGLVASR